MCIRRRGKSLWSLDRTSFALGVKSTSHGFSLLLMMYFQFHRLPSVSLENVPNYWGTEVHRKRVNCHRSVGGWTRAALCPWNITPRQGKQRQHQKFSYQNIIKVTWVLSEVAANALGDVKCRYFQLWKEGVAVKKKCMWSPKMEGSKQCPGLATKLSLEKFSCFCRFSS